MSLPERDNSRLGWADRLLAPMDGSATPALEQLPTAAEIVRLLNAFASLADPAGGWRVIGPLRCSEESVTYRGHREGVTGAFFIKRPRNDANSALSQYEALAAARERLAGRADIRVPAAYPYLLDQDILVTEWLEAPTITALLRRPGWSPRSALSAVSSAGKWLKAYHSGQDLTPAPLDVDRLIEDAQAAIHDLSGWPPGSVLFGEALRLLERSRSVVRRLPVQSSLLHGDFKPANVVVDARTTVVIDIQGLFVGPVTDDITHFLLHLDLRLLEPLGWRLLPWRSALHSAFMQAYDPTRSAVPPVVLAWAELQRALRHCSARTETAGSPVRRALLKLCYAHCARLSGKALQRCLEH